MFWIPQARTSMDEADVNLAEATFRKGEEEENRNGEMEIRKEAVLRCSPSNAWDV